MAGLLAILALTTGPACLGNSVGPGGGLAADTDTGGLTPGSGGGYFTGARTPLESTVLRRLNAVEYDNTVRDLLGTQLTPGSAFVDDEIANGFDNNASALTMTASRLKDYQAAAEALAAELAASTDGRLGRLAPCATSTASTTCLKNFVTTFGKKAWRRPLTTDEVQQVVGMASATSGDAYAAQVQKALNALLMSPYFLYRVEDGTGAQLTAYELASRLSYFLWSSTPDNELLAAADDNSLLRDEVLEAQTLRLLADERATNFYGSFGDQWLYLRQTAQFNADPNLFPAWNDGVREAAIAQTRATVADLLGGKSAFHELFDGNTVYLNDKLAKFYGMSLPGSTNMVQVAAGDRRGLLRQTAILSATSQPNRTSIVHRGVFLMNQILCAPPPTAPVDIPPLGAPTGAAVTQRQQLEAHVISTACSGCHDMIDPYGFPLEGYDAIGMSRTTDNGGAIDTTTKLSDGTRIIGADDLMAFLATNPKAPSCFVQQLGTYAMNRTLITNDASKIQTLQAKFLADGQRVDKLITSLTLSALFRSR